MMTWTQRARALFAVALLAASGWAQAATPSWPASPFQYFARQFALTKVFNDFAGAFGLKLVISPEVQGQLNGDYSSPNPSQFLDTLAASNGLTWYYHGGTLYVDKASETLNRTVRVSRTEVSTLKQALTNLGIFDTRFGWGEFADRGVVIVSGPPAYVNLVSSTVSELGMGPSGGEEMRIFPLKHARAEDRTFSYRDQQVTTPGIASILRGLIADAGSGSRLGTTSLTTNTSMSTQTFALAPAAAASAAPPAAAPARRAIIEADQRLNAVIVRDAPERMAAYDALIRQLDVPTPLVEIEATIVEVNTDKVDQLGINWAGRAGNVTAGFGNFTTPDASSPPGMTLAHGNGINSTNILANTAGFFLSQINLLASKGEARVLGRPSVLTMDNLVAVLDLSETFYVRVAGERVAQLTPISTGTLLKVTPRLIQQGDKRLVQLLVDIQDGSVQRTAQVDTLPTVLQSNISTQAVVLDNDSLLIGGYTQENTSNTEDKVPFLGSLPGIGALFRNTSSQRTRRERMFLIRPHVVDNPALTAAAAALVNEGTPPATPAVPAPPVAPPAIPALPAADTAPKN